jgi:hypothetical protein
MNKTKITSKSKAEINWDKAKRDLDFIKSFQSFCQSQGWRVVVSGGYGLDILLGQITRTHNDVDIIIYGQSSRNEANTKIQAYLKKLIKKVTLKIAENDFMVEIDPNSPGFGANIYYVQVAGNPYVNLNTIIKQGGEQITNSPKRFPAPIRGKLNDLEIEVQNPHTHLADILYKQGYKPHNSTHDQDIANLRQITHMIVVDEILSLS